MKRHLTKAVLAAALGISGSVHAALPNPLYTENFDSITLGPSVNERQGTAEFATRTRVATDPDTNPIPMAYTHTGPAGWSVDNNFDNFGFTDLTNAGGSEVYDQTVPVGDPPVLLYKTGITGLVVGNTGFANQGEADHGVNEWEGWSFANKDFWIDVAGDQDRSEFTNATGTIAVVDADEYDDLGDGLGGTYMNSGLTTASIPVSGLSNIKLQFDSSWRPEAYDDEHATLGTRSNNQTAMVWYSFDGGTADFITNSLWDSDGGEDGLGAAPARPASTTYKPDATNETVDYTVPVPGGASTVQFTFAYLNAGNDWWWAIDNLAVSDADNAGSPAVWTEDFEGVTLGDSVNERIDIVPSIPRVTAANDDMDTTPYAEAFSHTGPAGWSIDNSGIKPEAIGDNNIGVFEWEGWTFSTTDFWAPSQGAASEFTKGTGVVAIADSDEFADLGNNPNDEDPNPNYTRPMSTVLLSPAIDITGLAEDTLMLEFDSAWDPEGDQQAVITVDYGNGEVEVLNWESDDTSANYHGRDTNETVRVALNNPAGATSAQVAFKYLDGSNNWYWAIDNVSIGTVPEPTSWALLIGLVGVGAAVRRRAHRAQ